MKKDDEVDFENQLRVFSDGIENLSQARMELLKSAEGIIGKILIGHLIAEELITICLETKVRNDEHLEAARLRFSQKINLVRAFEIFPEVTNEYWTIVLKLNKLRNEIAHDIEQSNVEKLSRQFIALVRENQKSGNKLAKKYGAKKFGLLNLEAEDALYQAIHYILGALQMITVMTNHFDALASISNPLHRTQSSPISS